MQKQADNEVPDLYLSLDRTKPPTCLFTMFIPNMQHIKTVEFHNHFAPTAQLLKGNV
jgi:hypothetical protein